MNSVRLSIYLFSLCGARSWCCSFSFSCPAFVFRVVSFFSFCCVICWATLFRSPHCKYFLRSLSPCRARLRHFHPARPVKLDAPPHSSSPAPSSASWKLTFRPLATLICVEPSAFYRRKTACTAKRIDLGKYIEAKLWLELPPTQRAHFLFEYVRKISLETRFSDLGVFSWCFCECVCVRLPWMNFWPVYSQCITHKQ